MTPHSHVRRVDLRLADQHWREIDRIVEESGDDIERLIARLIGDGLLVAKSSIGTKSLRPPKQARLRDR